MTRLILGLYDDWCHLDERIEAVTGEIEGLSHIEPKSQRLMSVPGVGPLISTALVAAIDSGEAFDRGRDLGLVPCQYRTLNPRPHLQATQQISVHPTDPGG